MLEWCLPEDASIDDIAAVKRVNPASWITRRDLLEQREAVPEMAYRRFHCQPVDGTGVALAPRGRLAAMRRPARLHRRRADLGRCRRRRRQERLRRHLDQRRPPRRLRDLPRRRRRPRLHRRDPRLAGRYELREVMYDPWRFGSSTGAGAGARDRHRRSRRPTSAWCPPPTASTRPSSRSASLCPTTQSSGSTCRTPSPDTTDADGDSTSPRSNNRTTRSSRSAWRSRRWRTSPNQCRCSDG